MEGECPYSGWNHHQHTRLQPPTTAYLDIQISQRKIYVIGRESRPLRVFHETDCLLHRNVSLGGLDGARI